MMPAFRREESVRDPDLSVRLRSPRSGAETPPLWRGPPAAVVSGATGNQPKLPDSPKKNPRVGNSPTGGRPSGPEARATSFCRHGDREARATSFAATATGGPRHSRHHGVSSVAKLSSTKAISRGARWYSGVGPIVQDTKFLSRAGIQSLRPTLSRCRARSRSRVHPRPSATWQSHPLPPRVH